MQLRNQIGRTIDQKDFLPSAFQQASGISSSLLCSSYQTTRISKNIIMWLAPAGPRALGSEKAIVCCWATRKKELRVPKDQFVLLSCQDFSGMKVSWQPQNYFTFPVLDPFNLFFFLLCPQGKSGRNTAEGSWLQHLLAVRMWTNDVISLHLSFCICAMGIRIYFLRWLWGLRKLSVSGL